jgi:hypothetical protein
MERRQKSDGEYIVEEIGNARCDCLKWSMLVTWGVALVHVFGDAILEPSGMGWVAWAGEENT